MARHLDAGADPKTDLTGPPAHACPNCYDIDTLSRRKSYETSLTPGAGIAPEANSSPRAGSPRASRRLSTAKTPDAAPEVPLASGCPGRARQVGQVAGVAGWAAAVVDGVSTELLTVQGHAKQGDAAIARRAAAARTRTIVRSPEPRADHHNRQNDRSAVRQGCSGSGVHASGDAGAAARNGPHVSSCRSRLGSNSPFASRTG